MRTAAIAVLACLLSTSAVQAQNAEGQNAEGKSKPNVLFIAIDDLNDWIGALGKHPQAITPNLDRLAKRSMLFTRAYCAAPLCNPSRTALMTGVRPASSGVYVNNQPWRPALPDAVTLSQYFMANGYMALGCGKIFHYQDAKSWNDYYRPGGKDATEEQVAFLAQKGKKGKKKDAPVGGGIGGNMTWGPLDAKDTDLPDGKITDWAIQKLNEKHARPLFLAVGYVKPHLAWHCPKKYFDMHPLDKIQLPKVLENDLDDVPPAGVKMAKASGDHKQITDKGLWKEAVQAYLACSTYMDAQLGRLLDALEKSPNANNTIIVLWSDHGWSHGQKQHWRKFSLWEQDCRVVFMIDAPGTNKRGERCERPVSLMDIYPTLVDLCKLPEKKGLEGNSLLPLLRSPSAPWEHPALTTYMRNNHSVRTEKWRYTRYADGGEELYDHDADPLEWKNLAKDPKSRKVMDELARHLPKVNAKDAEKKKEAFRFDGFLALPRTALAEPADLPAWSWRRVVFDAGR